MRAAAPPASRFPLPLSAGFTLMEVLVVLVIVGIISAVAVLSISLAGSQRVLEHEARRLAALVELQCEEAVLRGSSYAVTFGPGGTVYGFLYLAGESWLPRRGDTYRPRYLPDGVHARLWVEGRPVVLDEANAGQPQIVCLGSGAVIPFEVRLRGRESDAAWRIQGAYSGEVNVEAIHNS